MNGRKLAAFALSGVMAVGLTACGGQTLRAADCIFLEKAALPLFRPSHAIASPE